MAATAFARVMLAKRANPRPCAIPTMAVLFYSDLNSYQYERLRRYLVEIGYDIERTRSIAPYIGPTLVDMDRLLARHAELRAATVAEDDPRVHPMLGPGIKAREFVDERCVVLSALPASDRDAVAQWLRAHAPALFDLLKEPGFRSLREGFSASPPTGSDSARPGARPEIVLSEQMIDIDEFVTSFPHLSGHVCCEGQLL